jgi:repressor LexA
MIDEGIFDGDHVVIQQQETAENGDIVVALLEGEFATLKTFYKEKNGKIRLQPANEEMDPIIANADDVQIQGKVTGVIRRYN